MKDTTKFVFTLLVAAAAWAAPVGGQAAPQGNPIRATDTADPGVVRFGGKWYVTHTSSGVGNVGRYPILSSTDLTTWTQVGYVFPPESVPAWAKKAYSWWAPEIHHIGNRFVAYFTCREDATSRFVVGAAIADKPEGPYKDVGKPILRNPDVGLIDVSFYHDARTNKQYLIWKEDQNDFNPPRPTPLKMSELTSDGLHLQGPTRELLRNDLPWEGVLVEAPNIIYHGGWYYLFYSGNIFTSDAYSVGVARSRNIWGPYEKKGDPILTSDEHFSGPAHQFVITDEKGAWHLFYHARVKALGTTSRLLMHDMLEWTPDGWPKVNNGNPGGPLNAPVIDQAKAAADARTKAREQARETREAAATAKRPARTNAQNLSPEVQARIAARARVLAARAAASSHTRTKRPAPAKGE